MTDPDLPDPRDVPDLPDSPGLPEVTDPDDLLTIGAFARVVGPLMPVAVTSLESTPIAIDRVQKIKP